MQCKYVVHTCLLSNDPKKSVIVITQFLPVSSFLIASAVIWGGALVHKWVAHSDLLKSDESVYELTNHANAI